MTKRTKKMASALTIAILAMTAATTAMAMPTARDGAISGTSEIRFSDMMVNRDGTLTFTLNNVSDKDAVFNGKVLFGNDEGIQAASQIMTGIPIAANGDTQVTVNLENGSYRDYESSNTFAWSGVRVYGEGRAIVRADDTAFTDNAN